MAKEEEAKENISEDELGEALAASLGLETEQAQDTAALDDFFSEFAVPEEPQAEATADKEETPERAEAEPKSWVHEPTGKEFDNELDYLRYNSGWSTDKLGNENKSLRSELDKLQEDIKSLRDNGQKVPTASEQDIMRQIWPDLEDSAYSDPGLKLMFKGMEKTAEMLHAQFKAELEAVKAGQSQLATTYEQDRLRTQFGVDESVEQRLLEKHPGLADLPPKARLAVMKDLYLSDKGAEQAAPVPKSRVPQKRAVDHVEGSVVSPEPNFEATEKAIEDKLMSMDDDERTTIFGQLFANSEFGQSLKGDF